MNIVSQINQETTTNKIEQHNMKMNEGKKKSRKYRLTIEDFLANQELKKEINELYSYYYE